jgi:hypothetical protein
MAAVAGPTQEGSGKLEAVPKDLPSVLAHRVIPCEGAPSISERNESVEDLEKAGRVDPRN